MSVQMMGGRHQQWKSEQEYGRENTNESGEQSSTERGWGFADNGYDTSFGVVRGPLYGHMEVRADVFGESIPTRVHDAQIQLEVSLTPVFIESQSAENEQ